VDLDDAHDDGHDEEILCAVEMNPSDNERVLEDILDAGE
jgi:hypothetical protein